MNDSGVLANSGPAPPPPPPPPVAGQVPALRISTASEVGGRRGPPSAEAYEPPAAIQNAMMTKDKKPFTYTPGMGGKLDLSQIRSPRMARRVAKNANDEGIEGPPKMLDQPDSPYQQQQQQPSFYSAPQVAVPVFPQNQQPAQVQLRNSCLPRNPVADRAEPRPQIRIETSRANPAASEQTPTPPTSPTQVTLAKAPTPWMQKQVKQQEQLPEWAKRAKDPSSEISNSPQIVLVSSPMTPTTPPTPTTPQQQPQRFIPQANMRPVPAPAPERNVPMRIEDRPSVFSVINDPNSGQHHQLSNTNPHHMSRWGNPIGQSGYQGGPAVHVVPIQQQQPDNHYNQNQNQMQYRNVPDNRGAPGPNYNQPEPGPLQSNSFRVLQKITDTYNPDQQFADGEQLRKLQLTEDDRYLMNKFKEQVDGDTYLHQEEDPRYRGAAIPSRAFRYLQNMTDSAPDLPQSTSRPANATPKKPNRQSNTFVEVQPPQPYIPASQQQVQEPKKYTGGAIPSRSFRILQQMTTPESIGCPWRAESSTVAEPPSDRCAEEHSAAPAPEECRENDDRCVEPEETRQEESEKEDSDEENGDSSDSSCDSESYWAYSTGLNPRRNRTQMSSRASKVDAKAEESDATDCEKLDVELEDDTNNKNEEDEDAEVTVSISLPLRIKRVHSEENDSNLERVETCVDFTLRRTISREVSREDGNEQPQAPKFVITDDTAADDGLQVPQTQEYADKMSRDFLRVRSTSREEATDDEDSGVCTSDLHANRISENDTDTECKPLPSPKRQPKKYDRTQTHSRLFRLISDEQLRPPTEPTPDNKRADDSYYQTYRSYSPVPDQRRDDDSYYQTWRSNSPTPNQTQAPQIAPRFNVFCPRTDSAKNIPRIFALRNERPLPRSCLKPTRTSCTPIPPAMRMNRQC